MNPRLTLLLNEDMYPDYKKLSSSNYFLPVPHGDTWAHLMLVPGYYFTITIWALVLDMHYMSSFCIARVALRYI